MKKIKDYLPFISIGFSSFLLIIFLHYYGAFSSVESKLYNMRFKLRGPLIGWNSEFSKSKFTESFQDSNNNGVYDLGEIFFDYGMVPASFTVCDALCDPLIGIDIIYNLGMIIDFKERVLRINDMVIPFEEQ